MLDSGSMNGRKRAMQQTTLSDDVVMDLVEQALACPSNERQSYLQEACGHDSELFRQAWKYVEAEERMGGFLLDPVCSTVELDPPFEPGQVLIHRFRILREVARGGMGIVWEAMDEKLHRRVAIKCAKAGFGKQLPPEVRNAREISHTNVCKIFEIHTASTPKGEIDFISMEFVDGVTLSERLRNGPLPKKERLRLALQLCAGLAEAHRTGVIHGDFKSNNVMLTAGPDGSERTVIMDFGLARMRDNVPGDPYDEGLAGTAAYMAPELWKGVQPSVASDIYALGVVFWEMVSGRRPSDLGVTSATLAWEERPAWKPPKGFGKWDRVIGCCLKADPECRFGSAEEVARALGPSRTAVLLSRAAVAAVLAIAASLFVYWWVTRPAERVRLALLPFASDQGSAAFSDKLLKATAEQLAHLKGTRKTGISFIAEDKVLGKHADTPAKAGSLLGATHVLRGTLVRRNNTVTVQAYLTDVGSGVNAKEWNAVYSPAELRYAPVALRALVTSTWHLPVVKRDVNSAARASYQAGLSALHRDSGVDAALSFLKSAVAADSDSPLTFAGLAEAQWFKYGLTHDNKWLEAARKSVQEAESRNSDLAQVHAISGLLKKNAGRTEQAIGEYLRAIELDQSSVEAYRRLGEAYQSDDQLDDALVAFRKAVDLDPGQFRNFLDLAQFYNDQANYREAVRYARIALKLAPDEPLLHRDLGIALLNSGSFAAAENELYRSIHLRETALALHALGVLFIYEGKERQAIPIIKRALQLGPERYLWWMNLGTAYRRAGFAVQSREAYSKALDLVESMIKQNTRTGSVRAHLAYLCAQLGDKRRAAFEIDQALQQSPNDANTRWMAALTYEALDSREKTLSILAASPSGVIADASRWPDLADLHQDSRFQLLLGSHAGK